MKHFVSIFLIVIISCSCQTAFKSNVASQAEVTTAKTDSENDEWVSLFNEKI
jgi:PBP1b-binding outer membrane lipoprotein LpoB